MGFLAMNPLRMKLNFKATRKNSGEITCEDGFLAERGLEKSPHLTLKGEEIKDYIQILSNNTSTSWEKEVFCGLEERTKGSGTDAQ